MTKYSLIPHYSKSLTETQTWNKTLKNGKIVTLKVYNEYRCFKIEIELTDEEKLEILSMDKIPLDKYSFIPDEMEGCHVSYEIMNDKDLTEEEKHLLPQIVEVFSDTEFGKFLVNVKAGSNFGEMKNINYKQTI
jgi:hypothetical protein